MNCGVCIWCNMTSISVTIYLCPVPISTWLATFEYLKHRSHVNELQMNNINDQLDATITILLIFESVQHVSVNILPIFRSVRLWFTAMWCIVLMLQQVGGLECGGVNYVYGVRGVARATSLTPYTQSTPPHSGPPTYYNIRTIHHIAVNHSLTLLKMGKILTETLLN